MILKGLKTSSHTLWPYSRAVFSIHHGKYQAFDVMCIQRATCWKVLRWWTDDDDGGDGDGDDADADASVDDADGDFDFVDYDEEDEEEEGEDKYDEEDVLLIIIIVIHHFTSSFLILIIHQGTLLDLQPQRGRRTWRVDFSVGKFALMTRWWLFFCWSTVVSFQTDAMKAENLATRSFDLRPSEHDSLGPRACPFLRGGLERWSERSGKAVETLISVTWLK